MKKIFVISLLSLLALQSYAEDSKKIACDNIKDSCKMAGFSDHGHKNNMKGILEDCFRPIIAGKNISGVNVNAADLSACKERVAIRKAKRIEVQKEAKDKRLEGNGIN